MMWVYLVFSALGAGVLVLDPGSGWDSFFTVYAVINFGLFLDRCLERHWR